MACFLGYTFIYDQNNISLSDFPIIDPVTGKPGNYFSLTADAPVTIPRTAETFTVEQQRNIFSMATTAFYIILTVSQFFHIWVCKTRHISVFVHGLFANFTTVWGVLVGMAIVIFFSYVPGVHAFVGSAAVNWTPWAVAPVTGIALWIHYEGSKWIYRRYSNGISKMLVW